MKPTVLVQSGNEQCSAGAGVRVGAEGAERRGRLVWGLLGLVEEVVILSVGLMFDVEAEDGAGSGSVLTGGVRATVWPRPKLWLESPPAPNPVPPDGPAPARETTTLETARLPISFSLFLTRAGRWKQVMCTIWSVRGWCEGASRELSQLR